MNSNLRALQMRLLEVMKAFQQICEENGFCYYVLAGTCLGAVRHHGFIPWDDDIDIGMPRQDYDRLLALSDKKFPEWMERRHFCTMQNYPLYYLKLMDRRTTLVEEEDMDHIGGVFVDVFPLDGARPPHFYERMRYQRIRLLNRMIQFHCTDSRVESMPRKILRRWAKMQELQKLWEKLDSTIREIPFGSTGYIANYAGYYKEKEWMPLEIMGSPRYMDFEDTKVCVPMQMDKYLTLLYGDYKKLPPLEKRGNQHQFSVVDLNTPYDEYRRHDRRA